MSSELTQSHKRILEILAEKKEASIELVAKELGVKPATVRKYALTLERLGFVERSGEVLKITGRGVEAVATKAGEAVEAETRTPMVEVEGRVASIPFIFFTEKGLVPLKATSLEQLAAIVYYRLVEPDDLEWLVRGGYLSAWLRTVLNASRLAEQVEELKGLTGPELVDQLTRILKSYLRQV